MEKLEKMLVVIGVLCLILSLIGVLQGTFRFGLRSVSYVGIAHTLFLLAIIEKVFEKK